MLSSARVGVVLLSAVSAAAPQAAISQPYPDKPIRLVVPYPPGGATDLMGRLLQSKLSGSLNQPIIVDNRGGATGAIGARHVAQSAPDGYTLLFTVGTDMALNKILSRESAIDPERDLTPIAAAVASITCIAAKASLPAKSMAELVALAKVNPGKLTFGSPGINSFHHLAGAMLKLHGVDLLHVPFKGSGPSMAALAAGQIDLVIGNLNIALAQARNGKAKVFAVTHAKRFEGLPEIPSVAEVVPGAEMPSGWYGFFGPARTPGPIVALLNAEIVKALKAPDLRPKIEEATFSIIGGTPEEFAALVKNSMAAYAKIVKAVDIQ